MSSNAALSIAKLRDGKSADNAAYLRDMLKHEPPVVVCESLLEAVNDGLLQPYIMDIFLNSSKSVDCMLLCLEQTFSRKIRVGAMHLFQHLMRDTEQWGKAWTCVGGVKGILKFLSSASVREVNQFVSNLRQCRRGARQLDERNEAIEGLVISLLPTMAAYSTQEPMINPDRRPLQARYLKLLPACGNDFVVRLLQEGDQKVKDGLELKAFLKTHRELLRQYVEDALHGGTKVEFAWFGSAFEKFASYEPSVPGKEHKFSASMEFSERSLRWRVNHVRADSWPSYNDELVTYRSLLRRCRKRRLPKERFHEIVSLGLDVLKSFPTRGTHSLKADLWKCLVERWTYDQPRWEDLFMKALQLQLPSQASEIGIRFTEFPGIIKLDYDRRWELFRLYNLYIPKKGGDVDDIKNISKLAKKQWPLEVFELLHVDRSLALLRELLRINLDYDFLPGIVSRLSHNASRSILSMQRVGSRGNFNVLLLLGLLGQRSENAEVRRKILDELTAGVSEYKQKSAASREQEERAEFAQAACFMAIASGSLEVYAKTVDWLQRFVRDPLTVKTLFRSSTVETSEGIELLSGLTESRKSDKSLAEASAEISKANSILQTFSAHRKLAEREPSYNTRDWSAIASLCAKAIGKRIDNAERLQKSLSASDGDMYGAVWSQTFAILSQIGFEPLTQISGKIQTLLYTLSPKILATTIGSLLATDDTYRQAKSKTGSAADESRILEQLAYRSLNHLAAGDSPMLARDLIIRTIIDRPDGSSWHRSLLTLGYLRSLGAKAAEGMLLDFANAIGEKLQEQSYVRVGEAVGAPSLVKVSTVKYLAQLLKGADFISASACVNVLVELFKNATHIDIRIATFESLISTLLESQTQGPQVAQFNASTLKAADPLVEKSLAALEAIIPIAGSINERKPIQEGEWEEAEADPQNLPNPYNLGTNRNYGVRGPDMPPLLQNLIDAAVKMLEAPAHEAMGQIFLARIVMPTVNRLIAETERWLRIFVRKQNWPPQMADQLPIVPFTAEVLTELLDCTAHLMPKSFIDRLDEYSEYIIANQDQLMRQNAGLNADIEKRTQPDVQYWLALYNTNASNMVDWMTSAFLSHIDQLDGKPSELPEGDAIKIQHLQTSIFTHIELLLDDYVSHISTFDKLMNFLRPPQCGVTLAMTRWIKYRLPILKKTATKIDKLRSDPAWLHAIDRKPAILPYVVTMETWVVIAPLLATATRTDRLQEYDHLVENSGPLVARLRQLIRYQLGTPLRTVNYRPITAAISSLKPSMYELERVVIGVLLGEAIRELRAAIAPGQNNSLTSEVEAGILLDIAEQFVESASDKGLKLPLPLAERIQRLPSAWMSSPFEYVREAAVRLSSRTSALWNERDSRKTGS